MITKENKSIENITLYELMADDCDVWVTKDNNFGYKLQLDSYNFVVDEKEIHPCAMEGLADFCKRYLAFYNQALKQDQKAA